ncbi:MAG: hypothetical protein Q8O46_00335 [bacterium]|nr:hypothetical protein [bacterium]
MDKNKAIEALELFNEKTDKLLKLSFTKHVHETGLKISLKASISGKPEITHTLPNEEAMDAFALTIRFFVQDNERCSIRNIAKVYDEMPLSNDLKNDFSWVRNKFNSEFDKESFMKLDNEVITYQKMFDVFIYGGLAHANTEKKQEYNRWMENKYLAPFICGEFYNFIFYFLNCIAYIKKINIKAIEELKNL